MRIRRRRLRDGLVVTGCLVASITPAGLAATGLLLALGSALHLWSKGCLEQNQRLVTAGPYRFTRNPFYLANLLIDLGLCAMVGRVWVALPYLVLWVLAYRETIRREEARLAELFPGEFERYAAAVPRLIPTGRTLPCGAATGRFTFDNPALSRGSEYARLVGVWVAAATVGAWAWIRSRGLAVFADENAAGLGLVVLVPIAWVVKLAIAELFRRPGTALLPFERAPLVRRGVTFACAIAVVVLPLREGRLTWPMGLPGLWLALAALDFASRERRRRLDRHAGRSDAAGAPSPAFRPRWPFLAPIFCGALAAVVLLAIATARL